jgi:KEOPS complex subunit Cgi121
MELREGVAEIDDLDAFLDELAAVGDRHGVAIQAFDARYVAGHAHLERAVACAERAIEREDAIARDPAVEILLYAAGRRQIDRALTMGVSEGRGPVVVLAHATGDADGADAERRALADLEGLLVERQPTVEGYDEELVVDFFDVGDRERAATDARLADLVCERVALLAIEK